MIHGIHPFLAVVLAGFVACAALGAGGCQPSEEGHAMTAPSQHAPNENRPTPPAEDPAGGDGNGKGDTALATFAAGCFWGVEAKFRQVPGVVDTAVGYTGGHTENPTYKQVCTGTTGHAEAVRVTYDPDKVTFDQLLDAFWNMHNPTTANRQGPDVGSQYRSAIFYHAPAQEAAARESKAVLRASGRYGEKPIVTQIEPAGPFWRAEEYHQRYLEKQGRGTCGT